MESSNQETEDETKFKITNPREINDKEDNRQNLNKKLAENFGEEM